MVYIHKMSARCKIINIVIHRSTISPPQNNTKIKLGYSFIKETKFIIK